MRVFLCEKPSQGKDIARVLGATQRGSGCYSGAGVVVNWCIGAAYQTSTTWPGATSTSIAAWPSHPSA